jgi:hypothetical protein
MSYNPFGVNFYSTGYVGGAPRQSYIQPYTGSTTYTYTYNYSPPPGPPASYNLKTKTWGQTIPVSAGERRVPGMVIWIKVSQNLELQQQYNPDGLNTLSETTYLWSPYADVAYSFGYNGEKQPAALSRLYLDGALVDLALLNHTWYQGTEDQLPDPTILAHKGAALTTAFRGQNYIVIRGLDLSKYGNRIPAASAVINSTETGGAFQIYRYDGVPKENINYLLSTEWGEYVWPVDTALESIYDYCWVADGYLYNIGLEADQSEWYGNSYPPGYELTSFHRNNLRILRRPVNAKPGEQVEKWSVVGGVDHYHDWWRWETNPSIDPYTGDVWFSPIVQDVDYPWVRLYCMRKVNNYRIENGPCKTHAGWEYAPVGYSATHAVWVTYGWSDVYSAPGRQYMGISWVEKPTTNGPNLVISSFHDYPSDIGNISDLGYTVDASGDLWLFGPARLNSSDPTSRRLWLYRMPGPGKVGHGTWQNKTPWGLDSAFYPTTNYANINWGGNWDGGILQHMFYARNTNRLIIFCRALESGINNHVQGVYDIATETWVEYNGATRHFFDADLNLVPGPVPGGFQTVGFKVHDASGSNTFTERMGQRNHDSQPFIWLSLRLSPDGSTMSPAMQRAVFVKYSAEDWSVPLQIVPETRYGANAGSIGSVTFSRRNDTWIENYNAPALYSGDRMNTRGITDLPNPADTKPNSDAGDPPAWKYWAAGENYRGHFNPPFVEIALTGGTNTTQIGSTLSGSLLGRATVLAEMEAEDLTFVNLDDPITGWLVWETSEYKAHLANDGNLFGFDWFESGTGIKAIRHVDGQSFAIARVLTTDDLIPLENDEIRIARVDEQEIPSVGVVNYVDPAVEFAVSKQRARRARYPVPTVNSRRTAEYQTSVIMEAKKALESVTKALFREDKGRVVAQFVLKPTRLEIEVGDIVVLPPQAGKQLTVRIVEAIFNQDFTQACSGQVLLESEVMDLNAYGGEVTDLTPRQPFAVFSRPNDSTADVGEAPIFATDPPPVNIIPPEIEVVED